MSVERKEKRAGRREGHRRVLYCLVPEDLADKLHEPLRRHFRDDPSVEVVIERRDGERRSGRDRRRAKAAAKPRRVERRLIANAAGRRAGERRAELAPAGAPPLPRKAQRHAGRLVFAERLEPDTEQAEDLDTARLVARAQAGDREAFATIYVRYFDRVYGYLQTLLRNRHDAEDAAQQVFVQVLEALPRYRRRSRSFRNWLFVIVRNYAIDELARQQRVQLLDPAAMAIERERLAEDADLPAINWISDTDLLCYVERLTIPQRQVLLLRYMLGLSTAEIARVLDSNPAAVRKLQSRALAYLRERLLEIGRTAEQGGGPERKEKPAASVAAFRQTPVTRNRRWSLQNPGPTG